MEKTDQIVERILAPDGAADFLGVPKRTLEAWRLRGVGPVYVRINNSTIKYRMSDLLEFLRHKTVIPSGENLI